MAMHYLTVQDVIWINFQITKRTQSFHYSRLEEATFYQYGYGQSSGTLNQAGRLLHGFTEKKPFASGNEATAFVACFAFLLINGYHTELSDESAVSWLARSSKDSTVATQALAGITMPHEDQEQPHLVDVRDAIHEVLDAFPKMLALVGRGSHASLA